MTFTSAPASDNGSVDNDLNARWDAALAQLRAHGRTCLCDPCVEALFLLDGVEQLIAEVWPK